MGRKMGRGAIKVFWKAEKRGNPGSGRASFYLRISSAPKGTGNGGAAQDPLRASQNAAGRAGGELQRQATQTQHATPQRGRGSAGELLGTTGNTGGEGGPRRSEPIRADPGKRKGATHSGRPFFNYALQQLALDFDMQLDCFLRYGQLYFNMAENISTEWNSPEQHDNLKTHRFRPPFAEFLRGFKLIMTVWKSSHMNLAKI